MPSIQDIAKKLDNTNTLLRSLETAAIFFEFDLNSEFDQLTEQQKADLIQWLTPASNISNKLNTLSQALLKELQNPIEIKPTPKQLETPVEIKEERKPTAIQSETPVEFKEEFKPTPKSEETAETKIDLTALTKEIDDKSSALINTTKQLTTLIKTKKRKTAADNIDMLNAFILFTFDPSILKEDYGNEEIIGTEILKSLIPKVWLHVYEYLGIDKIQNNFEDDAQVEVLSSLDGIKSSMRSLVGTAREYTLATEDHYTKRITDLESKNPELKTAFDKLSENTVTNLGVATLQLKNDGFLAVQVSWKEFCENILNRFAKYDITINGCIRVFPATVIMSSKDLPTNPQLQQAGIIVLWSGGFNAPVCMIRKGNDWMQFMISVGATQEQYMRDLFAKAAPTYSDSKPVVADLGKTQGNITAIRSGSPQATQVLVDTLMNHKPYLVPDMLIPVNQGIACHSSQTQHWLDTIIIGDKNATFYVEGQRSTSESASVFTLHSGDKVDPTATGSGKKQLQYTYQKPIQNSRENRWEFYLTAAYGSAFTKGPRSWKMCAVPTSQEAEIVKILKTEVPTTNSSALQDGTHKTFTKLFAENKPICDLPSIDAFADTGTYSILMNCIFFSAKHQRNFLVNIGMPLRSRYEAKEDSIKEFRAFVNKEIKPLFLEPQFVAKLDALVAKEKTFVPMPGEQFESLYKDFFANATKLTTNTGDEKTRLEHQRLHKQLKPYAPLTDLTTLRDINSELAKVAGVDVDLFEYSCHQTELKSIRSQSKVQQSLSTFRGMLFAALPKALSSGDLLLNPEIMNKLLEKLTECSQQIVYSSGGRYRMGPSAAEQKNAKSPAVLQTERTNFENDLKKLFAQTQLLQSQLKKTNSTALPGTITELTHAIEAEFAKVDVILKLCDEQILELNKGILTSEQKATHSKEILEFKNQILHFVFNNLATTISDADNIAALRVKQLIESNGISAQEISESKQAIEKLSAKSIGVASAQVKRLSDVISEKAVEGFRSKHYGRPEGLKKSAINWFDGIVADEKRFKFYGSLLEMIKNSFKNPQLEETIKQALAEIDQIKAEVIDAYTKLELAIPAVALPTAPGGPVGSNKVTAEDIKNRFFGATPPGGPRLI